MPHWEKPYVVTLVCNGNVLRSVIAELMLRNAIAEETRRTYMSPDPGLYLGIRSARVDLAEPQNKNFTQYQAFRDHREEFLELFKEFGLSEEDFTQRESQLVTPEIMEASSAVYCVSRDVANALEGRFPDSKKIYLLPELADMGELDLEDPFASELTVETTRGILEKIKKICDKQVLFWRREKERELGMEENRRLE